MDVNGHAALVTGGASGLGRATAEALIDNAMINGEVVRLDGALRMAAG